MSAKRLVLILLCFLPACLPAPNEQASQNNDLPPSQDPTVSATPIESLDAETSDLLAQYLALRGVPGQFTGGEWNEEVDLWLGRKHTAMRELGSRLGNGDFSCDQLTDLLQQPDHTVQGGDPLHDLIERIPTFEPPQDTTAQFLVYEWRGTHDFLFFVCENGRITNADWWYAGE